MEAMKALEVINYGLNKPNKNGHYYSREILDNALKNAKKPLYLYNRMPGKEYPPSLENIIGIYVKSEWQDNSTLKHTFQIMDKDISLKNLYPCMFGFGGLSNKPWEQDSLEIDTYVVDEFTLHGFGLSDTCAWECSMKVVQEGEKESEYEMFSSKI
jgi:hypothetical protein